MSQLSDAVKELKTINDMVRWAVSRFNEAEIFLGHGADNPWSEAIALILPALYLPHDRPDVAWSARLTQQERLHLADLIMRRIEERIPSAYLVHKMRFAGLDFFVDERVLVPRSPMAELIEKQFEPWLHEGQISHVLDLCTGSACIAIACAHYLPDALVDAVDISKEALEVAQINVNKYHMQEQVRLFQGDLFDPLPKNSKYDLIISNPPYVDADDMATLPKEYTHEPSLGLAAGKDGLDMVKSILATAKNYLAPEGVLIIEVGNSETALVEQFPDVPFTWLEFDRGDGGVFLLTYDDVMEFSVIESA